MLFSSTLLPLLLGASVVVDAGRADQRRGQGHAVDFSTFERDSDTIDEFLAQFRYKVSDSAIGASSDHTIARVHEHGNVDITDEGVLALTSRGQTDRRPNSAAQIESLDTFEFGTLETIAKATATPGVCQGMFFYRADDAEVDIELLSSFYDEGYKDLVAPGVQFTNQALELGKAPTTVGKRFGFDPTADYHNYTIRWTPTSTDFYVDSKFQTRLTKNVPRTAAKIMFNVWSNGNPGWSAGPPRHDAVFSIRSFRFTPL
ncbi:hypothetical protein JCM11491_005624 [Sporobolomyces phaffii]